jgi:hypothetical protein
MVISKSDLEAWKTKKLESRHIEAWLIVALAAVLFVLDPCIDHWFYSYPFRFSGLDFLLSGLLAGYGIGRYHGAKSAVDSLLLHLQVEEISRKLRRNTEDEVHESFKV